MAHMKRFVHSKVMPLLKDKEEYTWLQYQKNGEVLKTAIDGLIYTQNRAFRVAFAHKGDASKGRLEPWEYRYIP